MQPIGHGAMLQTFGIKIAVRIPEARREIAKLDDARRDYCGTRTVTGSRSMNRPAPGSY